MKIIFVSRMFDGISGGVERMAITMMNDLVRRGHQIELISLDRKDGRTFYPLAPEIAWHRVDIGDAAQRAGIGQRIRRLLAIRRIMKNARPDIVIGFQRGAFLLGALPSLGLRIPVVAAERNAPQRFQHLRGGSFFQFQSMRLAHRVTVQLASYIPHYPAYLRSRIVSIPNPVPLPVFNGPARSAPGGRKNILTVARLSYQKNIEALIAAFALVAERNPEWDLTIAGDGESRRNLESAVRTNALEERVQFLGAISNIGACYAAADIFCLPSRWEGFPNALAEAMSYGLAAIGYRGCAGVNELILHGETGLLADGNGDVAGLAQALEELMRNAPRREAFGLAGRRRIEAFAPDIILQQWEDFFRATARTS